jgi:leucyl aminopeptidase
LPSSEKQKIGGEMIPTSVSTKISVAERPAANWRALVVFLIQGAKTADGSALGGETAGRAVARLIDAGAATGKASEVIFDLVDSPSRASRRVYVVGLGPREKLTAEIFRQSAAAAAKALAKHKIDHASVVIPSTDLNAAEAIVTGFLLAGFDYREYKGTAQKKDDEARVPLAVTLVATSDFKKTKASVDSAKIMADAQNFCRTIANRPGNAINPQGLADVARQMASQVGLKCTVMDEKQLAKLGMGGILAVGAASIASPPRLIVLEHTPSAAKKKPLLVVGKAITFDTGGISIKPADKMGKMIYDKCGGVAVLGFMYAVAALKLPIHIVGILSSAENAISSRAYRPGDILRMYNGVTVEVTNTDAEGRLVLGDALAWGIEKFSPAAVVDLATLTGGVIVALGRGMAGIIANHDALAAELTAAGDACGEKIWRLPLGDEQKEQIKSDLADIVNSAGREGHPLQGGAFLSFFIPDGIPWAHLDIAGVADTEKDLPYFVKGATGWGVRTLVNWVTARAGLSPK